MIHIFFYLSLVLLTGLFEQRVDQYLEELPDTEQSGVNKFLKGLGEFCSRLRFQEFKEKRKNEPVLKV